MESLQHKLLLNINIKNGIDTYVAAPHASELSESNKPVVMSQCLSVPIN